MHNLYGFLEPCQNLEKTNDIVPRKHWTDERMDGRTEGRQNLFYRTPPAIVGGPKNQLNRTYLRSHNGLLLQKQCKCK